QQPEQHPAQARTGRPGAGELHDERGGGEHGDGHAGHAEGVAQARRGGVRQALEGLDEAHRRHQVQQCDHVQRDHWLLSLAGFLSFFLNISSMRRVTRNPPNTFTAARATATTPMPRARPPSVSAAASMAPTMMMAEIALVTAIRGVCSAGVTFHTTW